jgi:hypothetical protein
MLQFTAKKRGEIIRRYRKVKTAALNLSIGLLAVAALLVLGLGTNGSFALQRGGGGSGGSKEVLPTKEIIQPIKVTKVFEETAVQQPSPVQAAGGGGYVDYGGAGYDAYGGAAYGGGAVDPALSGLAPGGGGAMIGGAPTVVDPTYAQIANNNAVAVSPTVLQY